MKILFVLLIAWAVATGVIGWQAHQQGYDEGYYDGFTEGVLYGLNLALNPSNGTRISWNDNVVGNILGE